VDPRLTPLYEIFKVTSRHFLNAIDGMDDDQAAWRASEESNSAGFIALHVVQSRHTIAKTAGLEIESPFEALTKGRRSIAEMRSMPAMDELREDWKKLTGELRVRFGQISPAELDKDTGIGLPVDDKSVLGVLAFLFMHEAYHIGQLGLLRKQVGLSAMALR
jgi:uncharacterized damage-inducible protein DinB